MWIRSQNKEMLIDITNQKIFIENQINEKFKSEGYIVYLNNLALDKNYELGQYKAKGRALEVLNEIQKSIVDLNDSKSWNSGVVEWGNAGDYQPIKSVYEMPKE